MIKRYLAPSILSADFTELKKQIKLVEKGGADFIHCDIMDGQFVPNLTFGPMIVEAADKCTNLPLDVHLMIKTPDHLIEEFSNAGADFITVHFEEVIHLNRTIKAIKKLGVKAGVALNPATPFSISEFILEEIDLLLIMSVNPGFGGQVFIKNSLKKIEQAANYKTKNNLDYLIEVDGGISEHNIKDVVNAGCEIIVAGSSIFHSKDITKKTSLMKKMLLEE